MRNIFLQIVLENTIETPQFEYIRNNSIVLTVFLISLIKTSYFLSDLRIKSDKKFLL
jgi:hypothetical protein